MSSAAAARGDGIHSNTLAIYQLQNPSLLPHQQEEDNDNDNSDTDHSLFPVYNPARPDVIVGHAVAHTSDDAARMIRVAHSTLVDWRDGTTGLHRTQLLQHWSRLIDENLDDLAIIMTLESGKPLAESRGELQYAKSFVDFFAAEALRSTSADGGSLIPTPFTHADSHNNTSPRGTIMALHQAVGVCALLAPWNFPAAMILRPPCASDAQPSSNQPRPRH